QLASSIGHREARRRRLRLDHLLGKERLEGTSVDHTIAFLLPHHNFTAQFAVRHGWRLNRSGLPPTLCFTPFGLIRVLGDEAHSSNRVCLVAELSGMAGLATLPAVDLRQRLTPHGD